MSLRYFLSLYGELTESRPWSMAFATCALKGAVADVISQMFIERKSTHSIDWWRNVVFSFYGGWYCGCAQHFLYNIAYTHLFGPEMTALNALRKVTFDSVFHVPLVCFPVYYAYKGLFYDGDGALAGLRRCRDEVIDMTVRYYTVWIPANTLVFAVIPVRFRIIFVASTSLCWLSFASFFTHAPQDK